MGSLVSEMQSQLKERGEYVVLANRGWFAVFASTWKERLNTAKGQGRAGPNLIVHRTKSNDPNDHHVLPYAIVRDLLVEETVTRSAVNGSVRWNLTLRDGELHVSHRAGKLSVDEFYGGRLIGEESLVSQLREVQEHEAAFNVKVESSSQDAAPKRRERLRTATRIPARQLALTYFYIRNSDVVAEVLERANGVCEVCRKLAPFRRAKDGEPYLEVHHKIQLANGGEDIVENAIAVCPNCHRHAHYGET